MPLKSPLSLNFRLLTYTTRVSKLDAYVEICVGFDVGAKLARAIYLKVEFELVPTICGVMKI